MPFILVFDTEGARVSRIKIIAHLNDKMQKRVREPGLEPGSSRWQRPIVPLDHSRCVNSPPHSLPLIVRARWTKIIFTMDFLLWADAVISDLQLLFE